MKLPINVIEARITNLYGTVFRPVLNLFCFYPYERRGGDCALHSGPVNFSTQLRSAPAYEAISGDPGLLLLTTVQNLTKKNMCQENGKISLIGFRHPYAACPQSKGRHSVCLFSIARQWLLPKSQRSLY